MRAKKIIRRIAIIVAVIAALIAAAMTLLPWKVWVQQKLIATLEQQGLSPVQLTVGGIGVHGITLKNVSLGEPAISLNNLTLGYSLRDLVQQKMDSKLQLRSEQLSLNAGGTPVTIGRLS